MTRKKPNEIIIEKEYAKIIINSPKYVLKEAIIDIDDVEKIKNIKWYLSKNGNNFYVLHNNILLHRLIVNCNNKKIIDHINHNGLDNRKCNLRIVTQKENMRNRRIQKNNTSGYDGISWHKSSNKWRVQFGEKRKCYGYFEEINEAINFCNIKKKELEYLT